MNANTTTIEARFSASNLPRWAQKNAAVVDRCEKDLVFRCDVCSATTNQTRRLLVRRAEKGQ